MKVCRFLGMRVVNRPPSTCKWHTAYCSAHCYNNKMYCLSGDKIRKKDKENAQYWNNLTPDIFINDLSHDKSSNNRIRFMARGEAFQTVPDVIKVRELMLAVPNYLFWIPTRAWRNKAMKKLIEKKILPLPNNRVMASLDPTNTSAEIQELKDNNWSTMYFGDNEDIQDRVQCPKTWVTKRGYKKSRVHRQCRTCNICFSSERVDVHLMKH